MTPFDEHCVCHNLERIANALERQNNIRSRQADMAFLQLTANDQAKIEKWDKLRHDEHLRLHGLGYPRRPVDA